MPDGQESVTIRHKLASIIIPNIEFHSTTFADAIEYLHQEARRLDSDVDPPARGVNIFLKLPAAGQAATSQSVASSLDAGGPALPAGTGAGGGTAAAPAFPVPSASTRITLTLRRIPLLEALKYVAAQAGLKVRIEPYAVSLVPLAENSDTMITATFRVPPNFIGNTSSSGKTALDEPAMPAH